MPTRRRVIAIVLFVVALTVDTYALVASNPPVSLPISRSGDGNTTYWHRRLGLPIISLDFDYTLTAQGAFSVNNPVHVHVILKNVSSANLLQYYNGLGFTEQKPGTCLLIKSIGEGRYEADGDVEWVNEGSTWDFLWPQSCHAFAYYPELKESGGPLTKISGISDTLSVQNNAIILKLTWIIIGFSILSLSPILEALIVSDAAAKLSAAKHEILSLRLWIMRPVTNWPDMIRVASLEPECL